MSEDNELDCHFCEAWCCDSENELGFVYCDVCDNVLCVDCQLTCSRVDEPSSFIVCSECFDEFDKARQESSGDNALQI